LVIVKRPGYIRGMSKRAGVQPAVCSTVESAFNLLGRKWAGLIVHVLSSGPLHFCDMERAVPGVSARMLSERIKELEEAGVVTRTVHGGAPVRVVYALSDKGKALVPVMRGIEKWARAWDSGGK
jgi:DNA-binding HxlR family transcriptional regulator